MAVLRLHGKLALGCDHRQAPAGACKVICADGSRVSFGVATVRHLMKFLSLFIVMIGFMMSAWTKRRQALHDMPCDCLVIRVPVKSFSLLGHH